MSPNWNAGSAVLANAENSGDYRGLMLQGAEKNAQRMAEAAKKGVFASMGIASAAMIGFVGVATLASGGVLAPVACAVAMQGFMGVSVGGLVGAAIAKLWKNSEENKVAHLSSAVNKLERGHDVQSVVDFLGEKMAAKLGGWRESKRTTLSGNSPEAMAPRAPKGPGE